MVPSELKSLTGVEIIISEIKKYDLTPCKFKICLPHIKNVVIKIVEILELLLQPLKFRESD